MDDDNLFIKTLEKELDDQEYWKRKQIEEEIECLKECKKELNEILEKKEVLKNIKNKLHNLKLVKR